MLYPTSCEYKVHIKDFTRKVLEILNRNFVNLDVVLRGALIFIQAVDGLGLSVQLQPSVDGHPVFGDKGVASSRLPCGKNPSIAVHLGACCSGTDSERKLIF